MTQASTRAPSIHVATLQIVICQIKPKRIALQLKQVLFIYSLKHGTIRNTISKATQFKHIYIPE